MAESTATLAEVSAAPAPIPEGPAWRGLGKILAIIWGVELGSGFIIAAIALILSGFDMQKFQQRIDFFVPAILLINWIVALTLVWVFVCRKYGRSFRAVFALRYIAGSIVLQTLGLGMVCGLAAALIMHFLSNGKGFIHEVALSPIFAPSILIVPFFEELYYRGFLYGTLQRLAGVPVAFAIVAIWFGAIHVPQLFGNWAAVVTVTTMGCVFTYLRQRYGSTVPAITAHLAYNGTAIMIGLLEGMSS